LSRARAGTRLRHPALALAIAGLASASLLPLVGGCERLESAQTQADRQVSQSIAAGQDRSDLAKLQQAANESGASYAAQARAKRELGQAQLQAANALMPQIDANEIRNARLVFEIGQLAADLSAANTMVAGLNANDPAAVVAAADQQVAAAQGGAGGAGAQGAWFTHDQITIPTLAAAKQKISSLEGQVTKLQDQIKQLTDQRDKATTQADQLTGKSESEKGRQSVDDYKKAADLRKQAADLDRQINVAQANLAAQQHDLALAQSQQKAIEEAIKQFQDQKAAIATRWQSIQKQADNQSESAKKIFDSGNTAPPATQPGDSNDLDADSITAKLAALSARATQTDALRKQAQQNLTDAAKNFAAAADAAQRLQTELGPKINSEAYRGTPQAAAWKALTATVNPADDRLQQATAEHTLATLLTDHAALLYSRARLASALGPILQAAKITPPADLPAEADLKAQADSARENASAAFKSADDLLAALIENSAYATAEQKNQATVARLLSLYSASQLAALAGDEKQAKSQLQQALALRDAAVRDNISLPALPPDLAPAPTPAAPATPAPAGGAAPAPAATPATPAAARAATTTAPAQ
jgi:hypothetical protein